MDINSIGSSTINSLVRNATAAGDVAAGESFAKKLEAAAKNNDDKELREACKEFEAIMLDMLYKQMKSTVIKSDLFEADPGREIFESMLDEKLMEQAAKTGSLGLADSLYKQLSRQYGRQAAAAASDNTKKSGISSEEETER